MPGGLFQGLAVGLYLGLLGATILRWVVLNRVETPRR
jgi:hypothetical protein